MSTLTSIRTIGRKNQVRRLSRAAYLMLAVLPTASLFGPSAQAATETWTGVAGDGSWATPTNWSTTTPVAGDSLIFSSTTGATPTLTDDVAASFAALNFNAGAAVFTINPGTATTLTLTGPITDQSANGSLETFGSGLTVSGTALTLSGGNNKMAFNNGATFSAAFTDNGNSATADSIAVGSGKTMSFGAASIIGSTAGTGNTTTSIAFTGSSTSTLSFGGNLTLGGANNTGSGTSNTVNVDLSGIGVFNMTNTASALNIATTTQTNATLTLANTSNSFNVASINVGKAANTFATGGTTFNAALHLGAGTNTLDATAINVGSGLNATMDFAGAGGTVTIQGLNGGTGTTGANITVGESNVTTTAGETVTSTMNLAGHTANIDANTVIVGLNDNTNFNPGANNANLTFDTGTFNVRTLQLARETNSHGTMAATFTMGGGTLNVSTEFDILDNTLNDGNAQAGTFIMNGGVANLSTSIVVKATGANTATKITSTLTLNGGTLNMNGNAIGASGNGAGGDSALIKNVNMPGTGKTFTLMNLGTTNASGGTSIGDGINGAGLTMNGAGTLILDGTNSYGQTTVSSGTLQVGAGSNTGTLGTAAVTDNATLSFNRSDAAYNVGNAIGGNGTVKMIGTGTVTLSGSNGYSGITQINAGTLALSTASNSNIASSSAINIAGAAKLDVTGVTGGGGFILGATQNLTNNGTVSGAITGSGSTISGSGTYGDITLNGGLFMTGTNTTVGSVSASSLTVNSGTVKFKFSGATADSIALTGASNLTNSQIAISQLVPVTGASFTILTAGSTLTNITPGLLSTIGRTVYTIDSTAFTANPDQIVIDVTGGPATLTWTGADGTNPTNWDDLQTAANWNRTDSASGDTTHFYDQDNVTFDGTAPDAAINISVSTISTGNVVYTSGNNSFSGGNITSLGNMTVSGGCLTLNNANDTFANGINVSGGTLILGAAGVVTTSTVTLNTGTLDVNNATALGTGPMIINGGNIDNTSGGAIIETTARPTTINANFTFIGSADGTHDLNLGTGAITLTTSPTITVNAGNFTLGGKISGGTNSLTKNGSGTLILAATSSAFSGGLIINAGAVQSTAGSSGNTSIGSGNVTINAAGTLITGTGDSVGFTAGFSPQSILINGGTLTDLSTSSYRVTLPDIHFTGGGLLTSDPSNSGNTSGNNTGQYSLFGGTVETDASSVQAVINAPRISLQHGATTFTTAQGTVSGGVDLLVSSALVNFATNNIGSLIKTGPGTMELSGTNLYTGNTTVSQGTLILASSTVNDNLAGSAVISVASGATLDVSQITTGGGFIMPATGNQTLSNSGTVNGLVTVQTGGTVTANPGGSFNNNVAANSGGTINGTGTYGAGVTINGGTLMAGNATTIGTLGVNGLSVLGGNVTFKFSGTNHDLITLGGSSAAFGSNSQIAVSQLATVTPGNYLVMSGATAITGLSAGQVAAFGRVIYTIDGTALTNNQLQLDVTGSAANILWTGTDPGNPTQWDNTQSTANWNATGASGNTSAYYDGDFVTFDNTGVSAAVNLSGTLTPGSVTVNSGNYSFNNGTIAGTGGLTVNGGNLTINNSNTFTGVTTINGGLLSISTFPTGTVTSSPIGAVSNAAANLVLNGGTLQYTGGTASTDHLFTLGANGGTISSTAGILTLSNTGAVAFTGSGTRTLNLNAGTSGTGGGNFASLLGDGTGGATSVNVTGNGTWTLPAANTYTGTTTVGNGATLKVTNGNTTSSGTSLGSNAGGVVTVLGGGTLDLGGSTTANNFNFGAKIFHISGNGNGTTGFGAITNTGTGTGGTGVAQQNAFQNIVLDNDAAIGAGNAASPGAAGRMDVRSAPTGNLATTLDLQGHTLFKVGFDQLSLVGTNITSGNIDVQSGMLSLETVTTTNGAGSITFESGTLSGFYGNTLTAGGNVAVGGLTWPLIYKGNNIIGSGCTGTTFVGSPIVLQGNVTLEPIQTDTGNLTVNDLLTLGGSITEQGGSFSMTKLGIGTNFFGGGGNYSGGLFVQEGTVALSANNGLSPNSLVTLGFGGNSTILDLAGFSTTIDGITTDASATAVNQTVTDSSTNASTLTFITATSTFGGVIKNGNGTVNLSVASGSLDLTAANTYTGNTSVNGGTLTVDSSGSITSNNISTSAGGTFTVVNGGQIPTTANLTNNGITNFNNPTRMINTLNGTTSGATVNLNTTVLTVTTGGSYAGGISGTGGLIVPVGSVLTTGPINANSLEVDGKQTFTNTTIRTLSKVNTLTVAGNTGNWTGALDLTSSRLVVEDSSGTRAADIATYKNMVANNVNGTAGIFSSTAAGNGQVVVVSDNAVRLATFGPAASNFGTGVGNVDANSILITEAVPGDANLDGVVDLKDLQVLAIHWQQPATDWSQTDFDGNGIVALPDLQALAIHWQNGVGSAGQGSGESFSQALSQISLGGTSSVPEPMSLAILGLGGVVLASRRRHK